MALIGAILGDICGSRWEFGRPDNLNWKTVELFTHDCEFTDDTVMSIATKAALLENEPFEKIYREFGGIYKDVSYGGMFRAWLSSENPRPYNSFGNGSAMRCSFVVDFFDDLIEMSKITEETAKCTHNHPEGIKGAVATNVCSWIAKYGCSKTDLLETALNFYPKEDYKYSPAYSLDEIRQDYKWDVTCMGSVPVAIRCVYEADSYEEFLRNVLSLQCDTDTICAIGGGIAEELFNGT